MLGTGPKFGVDLKLWRRSEYACTNLNNFSQTLAIIHAFKKISFTKKKQGKIFVKSSRTQL